MRWLDFCLWLLHVDLFVQFSIQVGCGEVYGLDFKVLNGSNGKDDSQSGPFQSRCKCLIILKSWSLTESLCYQSGFVPVHRSIRKSLDLEDPFAAYGFVASRQGSSVQVSLSRCDWISVMAALYHLSPSGFLIASENVLGSSG